MTDDQFFECILKHALAHFKKYNHTELSRMKFYNENQHPDVKDLDSAVDMLRALLNSLPQNLITPEEIDYGMDQEYFTEHRFSETCFYMLTNKAIRKYGKQIKGVYKL